MKLIKTIMVLFVVLVVIDLGLTYYGVTYLGMIESSKLITATGLYAGLWILAMVLALIGWILWKLKNYPRFKATSYLGFIMLCCIELAVVVNNIYLISQN